MGLKDKLWHLCSTPADLTIESISKFDTHEGQIIKKGKLLIGAVMQCDFMNCRHWPKLNDSGDCPGNPYKQKCQHQKRYSGKYREYSKD